MMKRTSLLIFLFLAAMAADAVSNTGLPTSVCAQDFCGPEQKRIWLRFQSSSGLDDKRAPGMYSGECFHNSPVLDGRRAHYGGILIDSDNDRLYFDGRFSFYTADNPYALMSFNAAQELFDSSYGSSHELEINSTFAFISIEDEHMIRRYWFRQDDTEGRLTLVGYFGPLHTILCDLRRNG
ncbi:MAG: hypothetical protein R3337_08060 [Gammaproteobacteria bacterium]|nr:hypothetical protein [Gammaproteobacteria bacterium]